MISLNDLLQTPRFSDLKLLTEHRYLKPQIIESVEITETPDVEKFIPKNVLILTTAMVFKDKQEAIIPFIDSLMRADVIGLCIKVGRFLDKVDDQVIAYANQVQFPIVVIPDHYPLGSLLHRMMNLVLETEREEIDFALDIQKRFSDLLVQDASNDLLVSEFSRMIKSPIILLDPFGQIISHSQHFKERNKQAEYYVQAVAKERNRSRRKHGSFLVTETDGSTTNLSLTEINVHSYFPHYLMIVNPEKVPYPTSVFAFEQAALVFQFNLYKNQKVDESIYANEAHFFDGLLNNQTRSTFIESNWLTLSRDYSFVQSDYYQVVTVSTREMMNAMNQTMTLRMNEKLFLSYRWLRKNIKNYFNHSLVIWRAENKEIVLILQEKSDDLSEHLLDIAQNIQLLIDNQLIFSVGYPVTDWQKIEQSYTQAKLTQNEKPENHPMETVLYYKDKGVQQLFNQLNRNEVTYFCRSVLKDLAYPTDDSKIDLRKTLETYLKNQGEITQTSNELFIHRNTVKYRINRCEEILGVKVDDPEISLNIRLALELSQID